MQILATILIMSVMVFGLVWIIVGPDIIPEPIPERYIYHDPILIMNDQNFTDYGLPGNGTEEDPYIIEGYHINGTLDAIRITETTKYFVIRNCRLEAARRNIYINHVEPHTVNISNNVFIRSYVYVAHCDYVTIKNNILVEEKSAGISLNDCDNSVVKNNTIDNMGSGVSIYESSYCIIRNNTIYSDKYYEINVGIYADGIGISVIDNNVMNQLYGIYIGHGNITVETNFVNGCYYGVYMTGYSSYANITSNIIKNCIEGGIHLRKNRGVRCINNYLENNSKGIMVDQGRYNLISNNTFVFNEIGVELIDGPLGTISYVNTQNNTIKFNLFLNCSSYGVKNGYRCRYSKIYLNSFYFNNLNGNSQAFDEGFFSSWYFGSNGNFWNEWISGDYIIDGNGNYTDSFSLVEPPI
ncbi:MAG: right-handed parallel beta-helix repeat-containing protein [Candidatus Heimdallarchaeaceae archaeon]